jgi:hypothetical protein
MWAIEDDGKGNIGGLGIDAASQRTGIARPVINTLIQRCESSELGFPETGEVLDEGAELVARRTPCAP